MTFLFAAKLLSSSMVHYFGHQEVLEVFVVRSMLILFYVCANDPGVDVLLLDFRINLGACGWVIHNKN